MMIHFINLVRQPRFICFPMLHFSEHEKLRIEKQALGPTIKTPLFPSIIALLCCAEKEGSALKNKFKQNE